MCLLSLVGGTGVILRVVAALSLLALGFLVYIAAQQVVFKLELIMLLCTA
jgi:hypothetical protein